MFLLGEVSGLNRGIVALWKCVYYVEWELAGVVVYVMRKGCC
jgi:hypothetical protein